MAATTTTTATAGSGIFLPFWNFMACVFVWYLFVEGLKALGLVKSK